MKRKHIKLVLRIAGALLALLLLLFIALNWYVSSHKKELLQKAVTEISSLIGGQVSIADMSVSAFTNFPSYSIRLKKVDVRDSMFAKHGHHFLQAENVFVRINPFKLLLAKISITKLQVDSGGLYLFTDTSGYTNAYLLSPQKKNADSVTKKTGSSDLFKKIELRRFSLTQEDLQKDKLFDFYVNHLEVAISTAGNTSSFAIKESILVRSFAFKKSLGSYLKNHLLEGTYTLRLRSDTKTLLFDSIPLTISKQPFRLTGVFQLAKEQALFDLRAHTNNITLALGKSLLLPKTAMGIGIVPVNGPVNVSGHITGSLAGGNPLVVVNWSTEKNSIKTPLIDFDNCSFSGMYINEVLKDSPRLDPNSKIEVYNFKGTWLGIPMSADRVVLTNLKTPVVEASFRSAFPLARLNEIIPANAISFSGGNANMQFTYKGPIDHLTPQNASLNGTIRLSNGLIQVHGPGSSLTNCNAFIRFVNTDLLIDTLECSIQGNPIYFSGAARNILALLGPATGSPSLSLNITAPLLNIEKISSIISRKFPAKKSKQAAGTNLARTAQSIDNLLSSGNIILNLSSDRLVFHRFNATKLSAAVEVNTNSWTLKKASLQHGNGNMSVTAKITERTIDRFGLDAAIQMRNMDAHKVWYEFEDFGLKGITYKNIRGTLSTTANVSLLLAKDGSFDMSSLSGNAAISIKNGELVDFKPIEKIQEVIFKKRDFSNVAFAEIKDKLSFTKGNITIGRMEINSSVLSLFVEGVYSLSGNTDISLQVPLSNLKKRDKDYKPENLGAGRSGGMSVFLRAKTGPDGNIKVSYDPFKRFRKNKSS